MRMPFLRHVIFKPEKRHGLFFDTVYMFVFFYLSGRYLYLVEDHRSPVTWIQVWLAILPAYKVILIG